MGGNVREICVRIDYSEEYLDDFYKLFRFLEHLNRFLFHSDMTDISHLFYESYHAPLFAKGGAYNSKKRDLLIEFASFIHPLYHETQGFRIVRQF